jgi:hypothetical protein
MKTTRPILLYSRIIFLFIIQRKSVVPGLGNDFYEISSEVSIANLNCSGATSWERTFQSASSKKNARALQKNLKAPALSGQNLKMLL